jgi:hypothetical protein
MIDFTNVPPNVGMDKFNNKIIISFGGKEYSFNSFRK